MWLVPCTFFTAHPQALPRHFMSNVFVILLSAWSPAENSPVPLVYGFRAVIKRCVLAEGVACGTN